MKNYVELNRNTKTRAQFAAACRFALRNSKNPLLTVEPGWMELIDSAIEIMDAINGGKQEAYSSNNYYGNNKEIFADRTHNELCSASADSYQIYYKDLNSPAHYNFIFEWYDGHGYFYCIEGSAE